MTAFPQEIAQTLRVRAGEFARALVDLHYAEESDLESRYGSAGRTRCLEDAEFHLRHLTEAVESRRPALFIDYIAWAKIVLEGRGVPASELIENLRRLEKVLRDHLPPEFAEKTCRVVQGAMAQLSETPASLPSYLAPPHAELPLAPRYLDSLLAAQHHRAAQLVLDAANQGLSVQHIYMKVFQPVLLEVGRRWQLNELSVAHEHYCTAATQQVMALLYPRIFATPRIRRRFVSASIGGDLHEIGNRMVTDFFEMEGWDTYYLGANAPARDIAQVVQERRADVVGLSATMTYHLEQVRESIAAVRQVSRARILVGGRPFNLEPDLWRDLGADGWAQDAQQAISVAHRLVSP